MKFMACISRHWNNIAFEEIIKFLLSCRVTRLFLQVAEGIFDVFAVFNATSEYVLYYHSGRKTIR